MLCAFHVQTEYVESFLLQFLFGIFFQIGGGACRLSDSGCGVCIDLDLVPITRFPERTEGERESESFPNSRWCASILRFWVGLRILLGVMMGQRQLVVAVETTAALGASWPVLFTEYVEKIIRAFFEESNSQKNAGEMALVVFNTHGQHSAFLYRQSGWTSSMDIFFNWLASLSFEGGGFGDGAIAEALAEALMMCCPGPKPPVVPQQKHCLLIAASNPYRLPTPVIRPLVLTLPNGQVEPQTEQWWLADAEAVAKAFPPCQVSLSVIAPRQLSQLRTIYNGAKRSSRAAESGSEVPKQQHLVLISEGFPEGKLAIRRGASVSNTAAAANAAVPSALAAKLEPLLNTPASTPPQPAAARPMGVSTTAGSMMGRQAISNGTTGVSMDNQSLLHNNVTAVPLPMPHPTTSGVSGADTIQTSDTSASSQPKVGLVAGNPSTLGHINNTLTQPHKMPGAATLGPVVNGGPAGLSGSSVNNPTAPSSLTSGQATILPGTGSVLTGLGPVTSGTAGMNTGMGHGTIGGGTLSANANTNSNSNIGGPTGSLVTNQLGPSAVAPLQPGIGPIPVSGAGQPQSNPLGVIAGMGGTSGALVTSGVNAAVNAGVNAMPPTSGLAQPVQTGQPLGPPSGIAAVVTPPQQPSGALKYTKLWEGILAGQRQQKPVPICKLEGYRQTSASEKLAADWPPTMQIVRLIAQDYMNSKEYQGKAELLVFRPLSQHGFLVQLAEKKLCAVIQLPSQTLLLASTDKPGRMIGMLFPGDMVVFKPNVSATAQQPPGAVAPMAGTGQNVGQTLGQSNFSQGQLQGQMNPQQLNPQQMSAQQLNPQQMTAQQMNPQQMNPQQLNTQQMGAQQMNSQQLNPQQMAVQQMNSQQMNPQQMSGQQINPQQMNVQQINPQMNVQHMNSQQMSAQQMNPQQTRPQIMPGPVSLQGPGYNLP